MLTKYQVIKTDLYDFGKIQKTFGLIRQSSTVCPSH